MQATHPAAVRPLIMVFGCTVLGAAAQILFKAGLRNIPQFSLAAVMTDLPLLAGLTLYGLSTVLLVLALREGELSILYPVIALTYAWVTVASVVWLDEKVDFLKGAGITVIIAGVAMLGRSNRN